MFSTVPVAAQVRFIVMPESVAVVINRGPFTVLHFGKEARKPYLHPLLTVQGGPDPVTRGFPVDPLPGDSFDHPNERGLAIGAENVNGDDFWDNEPDNPAPNKGTIAFQKLTEVTEGNERGTLSLLAHWISHEGKLLLVEHRTMTFYAQPAGRRTFDIDIELEAKEQVTFADQQYALIGLRLGLPWDHHQDGYAINAAGDKFARPSDFVAGKQPSQVEGRRSPWLVYIGITSGEGRVGVALFDHPGNLHYPARWQIRQTGFMMANPFGGKSFAQLDPSAASENAAYTMKPGKKLHFRYRYMMYNAGKTEEPEGIVTKVDKVQKEFAKQ